MGIEAEKNFVNLDELWLVTGQYSMNTFPWSVNTTTRIVHAPTEIDAKHKFIDHFSDRNVIIEHLQVFSVIK